MNKKHWALAVGLSLAVAIATTSYFLLKNHEETPVAINPVIEAKKAIEIYEISTPNDKNKPAEKAALPATE